MSDKETVFPAAPLNLTREQVEIYLARGRRARSDAVFGAFARAFAALRGSVGRENRTSAGAHRLTWKAR